MPIVINTNMPALIAQNALNRATSQLTKSLQRMSTGNRINSAADDPAGSYIASKMYTQIRGTNVAARNAITGYNMIATASSDMTAINSQLERIKDLATQYANGTNTAEQQAEIKKEVQQRVDEINRIAGESNFNDLKLLDGSRGSVRLQIGANADAAANSINVDNVFLKATTGADGIKLFGGEFADVDAAFASEETAAKFIDIVQASADTITERISTAGIYQSRLESVTNHLVAQNENLIESYGTVMDADIAEESANYTKYMLLQQTASTMLAQANQLNGSIALRLVGSLAS